MATFKIENLASALAQGIRDFFDNNGDESFDAFAEALDAAKSKGFGSLKKEIEIAKTASIDDLTQSLLASRGMRSALEYIVGNAVDVFLAIEDDEEDAGEMPAGHSVSDEELLEDMIASGDLDDLDPDTADQIRKNLLSKK